MQLKNQFVVGAFLDSCMLKMLNPFEISSEKSSNAVAM